uniref:Putative cytidylyltransferase n=1 Tax=viral metagenome TaxID=1070528 RepID=A0A6M3IY86_9ZZZZ
MSKVVVAVAGAFDPFHMGHLAHIREARKYGDYLIVILNTDDDVHRKRGFVFMPMGQRYEILKSLREVDEVVICIDGDGTVAKTLEWIKPDIFCKGGDRDKSNMPESEVDVCKQIGCQIFYGVGKQLASSTDLLRKIQSYGKELYHKPSGGDFK